MIHEPNFRAAVSSKCGVTSAKVKNEWSSTSSPLECLHGIDRENFTGTLLVSEYIRNKHVLKASLMLKSLTSVKCVIPSRNVKLSFSMLMEITRKHRNITLLIPNLGTRWR